MFTFQKFWRALFSCETTFEIRLFALLPTNSHPGDPDFISKDIDSKDSFTKYFKIIYRGGRSLW